MISTTLTSAKVYRHLLFNRLGRSNNTLDPSILRLGILLLLFDVYLTWTRVENSFVVVSANTSPTTLTHAPILLQYIFFLALNTLATLAHHITVRLLVRILLPSATSPAEAESPEIIESSKFEKQSSSSDRNYSTSSTSRTAMRQKGRPGLASPSAISTALLVSSCTKLFPILLVIWPESSLDDSKYAGLTQSFANRARSYVGWAVLLNNVEALLILLDCGYIWAAVLALAGTSARWALEGAVLATVGLEGDSSPVGDILGFVNKITTMLPSARSRAL